ncbi:MAG: bifunctional DNA-formamidopyrimidine glycosylase/DNA-(apurinic or apyrimidinic site) lyase [Janthinobacterium lividum]
MPELPEVEVTRLGIAPHLTGRRIARVEVRNPSLRWPVPPHLAETVAQRVVNSVTRRGKYLLLECDAGWQILHLGMSGSLRILPLDGEPVPVGKHDHVDWIFDECVLRLRDPRRFGAVLWHPREAGDILAHPLLASLGVEPLLAGFDGALLYRESRARQVSVKQFLLAGTAVVGVGNIYASESLFRAGIRPTTAASRVSLFRYRRLADAIRATLGEAIDKGGSSLRDYSGSGGEMGCFQLEHLVYGRAGLPCHACATPVRSIVQGQRSTFFCPVCQT